MTDIDVKKWYVVRAVSGQENKIKTYIESEIERHGLTSFVEDVLVPTEKVIQIRKGKKSIKSVCSFQDISWLRPICLGKYLT